MLMSAALRSTAVMALILMLSSVSSFAQVPTFPGSSDTPGTPAAAQNTGEKKAYQPVFPETTPYPVDVDRVKERVAQLPGVRLDDQHLRFYAIVVAKQETFIEKFAKDYDFRNGPTRRGAAMTHQEFLDMVTPKELNELFGATSGSSFAMLQAAVMNAAGQALIKKGLSALHDARSEREIQAIREQINRELAALLGKDQ